MTRRLQVPAENIKGIKNRKNRHGKKIGKPVLWVEQHAGCGGGGGRRRLGGGEFLRPINVRIYFVIDRVNFFANEIK